MNWYEYNGAPAPDQPVEYFWRLNWFNPPSEAICAAEALETTHGVKRHAN